jgi:hypothetical protein
VAADNEAVEEFFRAAMANGGREHHAPAIVPSSALGTTRRSCGTWTATTSRP